MNWILPGTVLEVNLDRADAADETFSAMFLTGGLVLSQVTQISGLESYIVQNWVRRGFLSPPQQRKYTRRQLSRILTINALKSALSIDQICCLLRYINGTLDDERDDIIDDTQLYDIFLHIARKIQLDGFPVPSELDQLIDFNLKQYSEPLPGAKERVKKALKIMVIAWRSSQLQETARKLMSELELP